MTASDAALEYHIRRLGPASYREFIAALWEGRRFETEVDGTDVVATRNRETTVIYPLLAADQGTDDDRQVDVVVTPQRNEILDGVPPGTRVLDVSDTVEMLRYAVDRVVAADICERHLGAPPDALALPIHRRLLSQIPTQGKRPSATTVTAAVVLLACSGLLAGILFGTVHITPSEEASVTGGGSVTPVDDSDILPPGITPDRRVATTALQAAHASVLQNESYRLRVTTARTSDRDGVSLCRETDAVVNSEEYVLRTAVETANGVQGQQAVYFDGMIWYVANQTATDTTYRRVLGVQTPPFEAPTPTVLRERLVTRYFSTPTVTVTGTVRRNGTTYYRVVGRGRPTAPPLKPAREYDVVAFVDQRGLVSRLTAEYVHGAGETARTRTVEIVYDDLGDAVVETSE